MAQLGTVLTEFSEEVVVYVTSPKTGLQRRSKWPPTLSEVLTACEEHQAHITRLRTQRPLERRLSSPIVDQPQGNWANFFVPADHPKYEKMTEWAKDNDPKWWKFGQSSDGRAGIWIPLNLWEGRDPTQLEERTLRRI